MYPCVRVSCKLKRLMNGKYEIYRKLPFFKKKGEKRCQIHALFTIKTEQ